MGDALPTVDLGLKLAVTVVAGGTHTCAILDDLTVKCWGSNTYGQLGLGDNSARGNQASELGDVLPPVDLGSGNLVIEVAAGYFHTCARLFDNTTKCWGRNDYGQLGVGDTTNRGDATGQMSDELPSVDVGTGRSVLGLAVGDLHTCALLDDASVKCWGSASDGQLGYESTYGRGHKAEELGDHLPVVDVGTGKSVLQIVAGDSHTCALLDDGTAKCWGKNGLGNLGLGDNTNRGDAAGQMGDNLPAVDLGSGRSVISLDAGGEHTCALLDNFELKCWGYNAYGQLGLGDVSTRGYLSNSMGDNLPSLDLGSGAVIMTLSVGLYHTCTGLGDASIKCWGYNSDGQLGLGDTANRGDDSSEMGSYLPSVVLQGVVTSTSITSTSTTATISTSTTFTVTSSETTSTASVTSTDTMTITSSTSATDSTTTTISITTTVTETTTTTSSATATVSTSSSSSSSRTTTSMTATVTQTTTTSATSSESTTVSLSSTSHTATVSETTTRSTSLTVTRSSTGTTSSTSSLTTGTSTSSSSALAGSAQDLDSHAGE
ncbi:UVR8 [Symbiodinium sp. CCMP2456]|nr:UVR8 [Symbiodinium sp. CCMP2456]